MNKSEAALSYRASGPCVLDANGQIVDAGTATKLALDLYGSNAKTAAAWCALNSHFDGREAEYRLWCRVFQALPER